ncbi:MAG: amidase [Trueperaceae bacterium]|nr:amidase [Trueperaceae bacterium]
MVGPPAVDVTRATIADLLQRLDAGSLRARELVGSYLALIEAEASLHALTTVFHDEAIAQSERVDSRRASGDDLGPLAGVPITIKDSIPTIGLPTTCNSRSRLGWVPTSEPLAITRVRDAGAIVVAKATPNEFLGIPSNDDLYPPPRNPFNRDHVAIGSSSGSGVAVAAGLCAASIGTDSAGSVRLPAAQNGLVSLKATRGRIPSGGSGAEPTLEVIGALTRTVADTRLMFEVMSGTRERAGGGAGIDPPTIGVPRHYIDTSPVEVEIAASFTRALGTLASAGSRVVVVEPRGWAEGRMATFVILYTEHHHAHRGWLRRAGDGYGRSARLYALQGAFVSAADYLRCRDYGERLRDAVEALFDDVDVLAMPTSPFVTAEAARRPGEHRQGFNTVFTGIFNLTGHPAITLPCGVSDLGIPIGLQLVGRYANDERLLEHAASVERAMGTPAAEVAA